MQRHKFISEEGFGKHTDNKSGMSLFPYKDRVIKANTIWKSKNPPQGMLMIRQAAQRYDQSTAQFNGENIWDVCWRSSDGKEEMEWSLLTEDILKEFDPVFSII